MQERSESPPSVLSSQSSSCSSSEASELDFDDYVTKPCSSFLTFRLNYLLVNLVVMLADGLQGTHLYVLYESYGFSVASLYCIGFITGAVTAPVTGPIIDKFGRKKSALLYCILEIGINMLEQYPFLSGIIASRVVGGVTTNLLSSVFETWLDTEYRRRGFGKAEYEVIMRDAVVVKNLAAIASGYLAHILAEKFGPVGPFQGAVSCTGCALVVILLVWTENYGCGGGEDVAPKSLAAIMTETAKTFKSDSRVLRVGIIQGLTMASLLIFVFLWSPILQGFARSAPSNTLGLDSNGEPAYGLIFGAFMAAGVLGGVISPSFRRGVALLLTPQEQHSKTDIVDEDRPIAIEFVASFSYMFSCILLLVPCTLEYDHTLSFSSALGAFVAFEFVIGLYQPCEGVIRSLYMPPDSRASMMTVPHFVVNVLVSLGVFSTRFVSVRTGSALIAGFMAMASFLQLSLVSRREWDGLFCRLDQFHKRALRPARFLSDSAVNVLQSRAGKTIVRQPSIPSTICCHHPVQQPCLSATLVGNGVGVAREWANQDEYGGAGKLKTT